MSNKNGVPIFINPNINEAVAMTKTSTQLNAAIPATVGSNYTVPYNENYILTLTVNSIYLVAIMINQPCTVTGICFGNDATVNGNVIVAMYDAAGTRVATSNSTAQAGTYNQQLVPFTAPYVASAGVYFIGIVSSSNTGVYKVCYPSSPCSVVAVGSFASPASITPPTTLSTSTWQPILGTY